MEQIVSTRKEYIENTVKESRQSQGYWIFNMFTPYSTNTTYEGNSQLTELIMNCIKNNDKDGLYWYLRYGVPKSIRAVVWYFMATDGCTYDEVITLKNNNLYEEYWNNVNAHHEIDKKEKRVIDCDVIRLFPEGYEEVFKLQSVRDVCCSMKSGKHNSFSTNYVRMLTAVGSHENQRELSI